MTPPAIAFENAISPRDELIAYETLWGLSGQTEKTLSSLFSGSVRMPSAVANAINRVDFDSVRSDVERTLADHHGFSICVDGMAQYPRGLRDARYPVELFYYRGDLSLTEERCVSIVGAREASIEGQKRAMRLARELVTRGFAVVSGLARGIDTAAMIEAIRAGGRVIGVIGTPITECYPKENRQLQELVAAHHLLISQIPIYRASIDHFDARRTYFPRRNATMAALSEATIIVEASETSGTHTQARACFLQRRKLFILNSCFENSAITWPKHYEEKHGAIRVREMDDIFKHLAPIENYGELGAT